MNSYWNKARAGRAKALETLATRRTALETGMARPVRRTHRSPLAQAIYAAEMESRSRAELVH